MSGNGKRVSEETGQMRLAPDLDIKSLLESPPGSLENLISSDYE